MAKIGLARVSSRGQSLEIQLEKLALAGCAKIYQEKVSGSSNARPQLEACLDYVREGDTLVVTRLDRLARSTLHLAQIGDLLRKKQVELHVLDQSINTADAAGRLFFNVLGAIAQFEAELIAERRLEGIAKAKAKGTKFGREKAMNLEQARALLARYENGTALPALMKETGWSRATLYRYLNTAAQTFGRRPRERPLLGTTDPSAQSSSAS